MPDRVTYARENPGIKNASWNKTRQGVQDIQEIAGAREWVSPRMQRDDSREGTGLEPLPAIEPAQIHDRSAQRPSVLVNEAAPEPEPTIFQCDTGPPRVLPGNTLAETSPAECYVCGATEANDVLVHLVKHRELSLCSACVERLVDAVRAELPKRRLRLALERMMAGEVTEAMVAEIEKLTGGK